MMIIIEFGGAKVSKRKAKRKSKVISQKS